MTNNNPSFACLSLSSLDLAHPGIAIATSRAGGIGLLDAEHSHEPVRGAANLARLIEATDGPVGLRVAAPLSDEHRALAAQLLEREHWLLLASIDHAAVEAAVAELPRVEGRTLVLEIRDARDIEWGCSQPVDALLIKGNEAGGWVGEDSTLILVQKAAARLAALGAEIPFYVQGGIGVLNAAACRVAGAAGVVLDDQLLLMPESPLASSWARHLETLTGQETRVLGEQTGAGMRALMRPGFAGFAALQALAAEAEAEGASVGEWHTKASPCIGWGPSERFAWPIGQGVGFAARYRDRYQTTGRLVGALLRSAEATLRLAADIKPLAAGSALAQSHGTRFPIVQGPMTRVSDRAEFAASVAEGGALPFLALALMRGPQVQALLEKTRELVKDGQPWGVGLLGFVPHALREEQLEAVWKVKPPFALIAGGRPDQALEFERRGVPAYIHVPAPELLRMFLDQGARRFVFEGRECGGHIGPLSSFVLWESMVQMLLDKVPASTLPEVHVLFAGGVHDATSAAMLSVLVAPLAERGARVGALMGSAYLFTEEIVASGAVVEGFQAQAVACTATASLETGPGHATRCAVTPFAHEFHDQRRQLMRDGASAEEIRDRLEDLNLGRLRIASKGLQRAGNGGDLEPIDEGSQVETGMYMIGQVATLRDEVTRVETLHEEVSAGSGECLERAAPSPSAKAAAGTPSDIAIIGIGTLLPGNESPESYWSTVLEKRDCIQEVPRERWDWRLYFDEDRRKRDRIYSRWGGFIEEVAFDPIHFGIPPKSLKSIDPMQLLALEVVRRGLQDAGYPDGDFDRENTSVIFGAGGGLGDLGLQYGVRAELPRFVASPDDEAWDRLPEWTEESFAGSLLNVVAGRVANRFDFGGVNFTVDAACASSLAALNLAVQELESGRSNVAIAGGVDTVQSPFGYLCFSKTQALSPGGRAKTFDVNGDGIVISEGLAVVVLKRLADAERDGDRIYAVVKAVGGSSDGKALGLTAPLPDGQMRALDRAYHKAGFSPSTVEMIEAHGTGTPVGDRAETETVVRTLTAHGTPARSCALGSVKTLIGHTKATAGVAGLIKVALSLHHRVLPAHHGAEQPIAPIADSASPVYLLQEPRPWLANPEHPRRGGVSSFGFGGTNFHAVVEGYDREYRPGATRLGARSWPAELLLFHGADRDALAAQARGLADAIAKGARPSLRDLAFTLARRCADLTPGTCLLAVTAERLDSLSSTLASVLERLPQASHGPLAPGVHFGVLPDAGEAPPVALLFPGQGSQYPGMLREPTLYLRELREALEAADKALLDTLPRRLSQYVFPPDPFGDEEKAENRSALTDTKVAQPAIGAIEVGLLGLLDRLGVAPVMAAGHSYGEYTALHAAGYLPRASFLALSAARGRVMAEACDSTGGTMAAVSAERATVEAAIAGGEGVVVANHNTPAQTVISGTREGVELAMQALRQRDIQCTPLPVAGAFHTELMKGAQESLSGEIAAAEIAAPHFHVYSNTTGDRYPDEPDAIRELLSRHLLNTVEFVSQVENMHAAGARVFIETGPRNTLTGMVGQILGERPHQAIAMDPHSGSLKGLLSSLGALACAGVPMDLERLFDGRDADTLDLDHLDVESLAPAPDPRRTWHISGGGARAPGETVLRTGTLPALTVERLQQARSAQAKTAPITPPPAVAANPRPPSAAAVPAPRPAPGTPAAASGPLASPTPATSSADSSAFAAYQDTMRQFLALQEQVMSQFLSGQATAPPRSSPAAHGVVPAAQAAATPEPAASSPVATPAPCPPAAAPALAVAPAAPATPAPAPAAAATMDREATLALLLELVSERTGYPADMLGTDQDMEAELGIDSIKRVEILGALQERLPEALAQAARGAMETLTRAKSLAGVVDALSALAPAAAPAPAVAPAAPATPAPAPAAAATMDREATLALLLELVSERTGYPADMLGTDQDMEAELGIDSIKRVEILGALQERLPEALAQAARGAMETLTRAKSLAGVVDALSALAPAAAPAPAVAPVAPATPALAPAAAATMDREATLALLLELVSERTGYPADMLGTDQDMEAELGIDSIKRVEILGALQERLPEALAQAARGAMETLTRAKSLAGVVDALSALAPAAAPAPAVAPAAPATPAPAPAAAATMDREATLALLLELVSERTGYPADMLGTDQDMEAELGIDSIKRVEILGALQERLPEALAQAARGAMETLTRAKSLAGVVDALSALAPAAAPAPAVAPVTSVGSSTLPRYVTKAVTQPLDGVARRALTGRVIITDDGHGVANALARQLASQGIEALLLSREQLADPQALFSAVADATRGGPAVCALAHLAPLAPAPLPDSLDAWRSATRIDVKSLFDLIQGFDTDLEAGAANADAVIVSASALDGEFARAGAASASLPSAGAASGLLKTLVSEWPGLRARCVDFDPAMAPEPVAAAILDEMTAMHDTVDVGYPGGVRCVFHTTDAPLTSVADTGVEPDGEWVVLVTAGARGITHQIARELARPGMRFVIAGRTPEPGAEPANIAGLHDAGALRSVLIEAIRQRGEQPTPAMVNRALEEILRSREIRDNLSYLRESGITIEYVAVDVRDEADFGALIESIYARHGRLDAVLHGAGIIEDKLFVDKASDSFARVFDTKADSTFILARHLRPEGLRLVLFFTSVAGRYGNVGQCDYSAANETVNRFAWLLQGNWPDTRVMAVNWGPWDAPGMASETVKRRFRERGIVPVAVDAGRRFFDQELRFGSRGDVEMVVGVGPWKTLDAPIPAHGDAGQDPPSLPLIRGTPEFPPGGGVSITHEFSTLSDPYLRDHCLDGSPVLPATAAAEWLAQLVQAAWPDWTVCEIRDLRVLKGFVLDGGTPRSAVLQARASSHADAASVNVAATIQDPTSGVAYYRATLVLRPALAEAPFARDLITALGQGKGLDAATAYQDFLFHGERFQLIRGVELITADGADASVVPACPRAWLGTTTTGEWLFDPGLLDTAPQLAIVWSRSMRDSTPLPSRLGSVIRYGGAPAGALTLKLRVRNASAAHQFVYDAFFVDQEARVRIELRDVEGTSSSALNRLATGT